MLLKIIGIFLCTYIIVSGEEEVCPNPKPICAFKPGVGTSNYPDICTAKKQGAWPFGPAPCPKKKKPGYRLSPEAFKSYIVDSQELLSGANGREVPLRILTDPNRSNIVLTPPLALFELQANLPLEKQRSFSLTGRTTFSRKPCNCPKDRWYTYGCDGKRYVNSCEARCRSKGVRKNEKCIPARQE